jgi:hypothetical protein
LAESLLNFSCTSLTVHTDFCGWYETEHDATKAMTMHMVKGMFIFIGNGLDIRYTSAKYGTFYTNAMPDIIYNSIHYEVF